MSIVDLAKARFLAAQRTLRFVDTKTFVTFFESLPEPEQIRIRKLIEAFDIESLRNEVGYMPDELDEMTVPTLRNVARRYSILYPENYRKQELITLINQEIAKYAIRRTSQSNETSGIAVGDSGDQI